jgi:small nuclear ribonucleoprotein (snRNP)-like protein
MVKLGRVNNSKEISEQLKQFRQQSNILLAEIRIFSKHKANMADTNENNKPNKQTNKNLGTCFIKIYNIVTRF